METGISKASLGIAALTLGLAACGAASKNAFSWLHPQAPPPGWRPAAVTSGATLAYPPSWRPQSGDPGTATAATFGADGRFLGYLNLTPRQGAETLSNWSSFRVEHNAEEGDTTVKRLAAAGDLRFLTGRGACVKDAYTTRTGSRYVEIACLVVGSRGGWVVVGAAPPSAWGRESAVLERAIEGVRT
jgi:hypothetical protein